MPLPAIGSNRQCAPDISSAETRVRFRTPHGAWIGNQIAAAGVSATRGNLDRCHMKTVLLILSLLAASSAQASVRADQPQDVVLRPVSLTEERQADETAVTPPCAKPIMLFMRTPEGAVRLLGVLVPRESC